MSDTGVEPPGRIGLSSPRTNWFVPGFHTRTPVPYTPTYTSPLASTPTEPGNSPKPVTCAVSVPVVRLTIDSEPLALPNSPALITNSVEPTTTPSVGLMPLSGMVPITCPAWLIAVTLPGPAGEKFTRLAFSTNTRPKPSTIACG